MLIYLFWHKIVVLDSHTHTQRMSKDTSRFWNICIFYLKSRNFRFKQTCKQHQTNMEHKLFPCFLWIIFWLFSIYIHRSGVCVFVVTTTASVIFILKNYFVVHPWSRENGNGSIEIQLNVMSGLTIYLRHFGSRFRNTTSSNIDPVEVV